MPGRVGRAARPKFPFASTFALFVAGFACVPAAAQDSSKPDPPSTRKGKDSDAIVIYGQRQSAVTDVQPLTTLNSDDIATTGATSIDELLRAIRPLTQSADGGDPIFLLNGQRTSGYADISALPPEAIDKVEVLPEPAALKFGYPPTRRVLNFITKRQFQQIELKGTVGTTTRGGANSANANFNVTRLRKESRFTLAVESRHTSSLLQSERHLLPDPDILFDGLGNVTGVDLGEIDPALSQLAGQVVTVAPVPQAEADSLAAYADAANQPRLFDVGPYQMLVPHNDAWKVETALADRLGGTLSGSINLSAEQSTDRKLNGPARAVFTVPPDNPFSPFSTPVLLHRYLTEVDPLHAREITTTLHGGGTLRGVTAGWRWDLTGTFDQKQSHGVSENGIDLSAADAAIAAGADPFAPLDPALLSDRLIDNARLRTRSMGTKLVVNNTPFSLPAGEVTVTGTVEAERLSAVSVTTGADPFDLRLARTRTEAGLAVDVPLTSRLNEVLPWAGDLSVNASAIARRVSGFGSLHDTTLGLTWSPVKGIQLLVQDKRSASAPDMEKLASPIVHVENFSVFDFASGHTEVVDLTTGGNPDLAAEHKHDRSIGINLKPFKGKDIDFSATYQDTEIRDQTGDIYALTAEVEAIYPERVVRDSSGRLIAVTLQPTNFYREVQRRLNMTISAGGPIGKPPSDPDAKDKRPHFYAGAGPVLWFADELQLRPGTPVLDIRHGDTVKGWGMPHATSYFYGGIGYLGNGANIDGWYQGSARVRSDNPASDLYFSGIFKLNMSVFVSVHHFLPKWKWTSHTQLKLAVDNVTDAHQDVHDRNGRTPNRFQPDFLDPIGRTVKLTLRKLFD